MKSARRLRWLAILMTVTTIVLSSAYWWRLSFKHDQLRTDTLEQAQKRAAQLAELQAHHMESLLLGLDLSLRQFRDSLQAGNQSGAELIAHNIMTAFPSGTIVHLARIDAKGYFKYATLKLTGPVYVGDRDYFGFHQHNSGKDQLFINKPIFSRTAHKWVVLVTRPIYKQGRFDGAAFISISPEYIGSVLSKLQMAPRDIASMYYQNGTYMTRSQNIQDVLGKSVPANRPFIGPDAPTQGSFRAAGTQDKVPRLYAWHKLEGNPLTATIGFDEQALLAPVEQLITQTQERTFIAIALVFALVSVISYLLLQAARQQQTQENSEAMLRSTLESTENGIIVVRNDGTVLSANQRFYELWDVPIAMRGAMHVNDWLSFVLNQLSDPETALIVITELNQTDMERSNILNLKDGRVFNRYSRAFMHGGDRVRIWSFRNITAQRQAEAQLRLAASVFSNSYEGIMIADADNKIIDINPSFTRITGYRKEDVLGRNPKILASGRHTTVFYKELWRSLLAHDFWRGEIWNCRKDGNQYPEMLSISVVRDNEGKPQHYIGVFSDISQLQEHVAELGRIANYDTLTGVPNRRLLTERIVQSIARSRESGKQLGVCCLDLDSFKPINDKFGHGSGDFLLIEVAKRLQEVLRVHDTLARLGGDEFVLLLNDLESQENCQQILERLLEAIRIPVQFNGIKVGVTGSIGITLFPQDDGDADTLLRHADQAMYRAKEAGKNRYRLFDSEHDRNVKAHFHQLQRLDEALEKNEFILYYQPKVNLSDGDVIGVEALIRWQHPEKGILPPSAFLDAIEGSELDHTVGEWVINSALRQIETWDAMGLSMAVSVNISANHLLQANFTERLQRIISHYPSVSAKRLELEIVEAAALNDINRAGDTLASCRELGVRFAIDDFGTGYSSLAYFRRLPLDMLKIDQSFVRDMLDDPNDLEIVQSVVRLANAFNRQVIAEGVETLEHGARLLSIGCQLCQGYGIARPMPPELLPAWLEQWREQAVWSDLAQSVSPHQPEDGDIVRA